MKKERDHIFLFFLHYQFFKNYFFLEAFVWVVQIFYQVNSCLIVLADEMWLLSVRSSIQAAIRPNVSGMFLSSYIVQYTYMDLKSSGPSLYLLPR